MTLTKANLSESICSQCGFSKTKSTELVETILEIIKGSLEGGEDVLISSFGKFCVKDKRERRGRNPATGNDMTLGERRVVLFRSSGKLREKIDGKR
jgi:integration host factor subunit alpha